MSSSQDYTKSYGVPRRSERITSTQGGVPQNYVVHSYGGRGDGFMMGYLAGSTPWMWSMPFHPAFYYSRPYYVQNPDGTVGVYPPTFSWGTLIMTVVVVGGIAYIVYRVVKRRRNASYSAAQSSFS